jgi:MFS transporter, putative metabolite:H+ symporter
LPIRRCDVDGIPLAFVYLGCWFLMAGCVYYFFRLETRGKSIEQIDRELMTAPDRSSSGLRQAS